MLAPVSSDFATARRSMVDGQLRPVGIRDERILAAMGSIPRELFVPCTLVGVAYIDDDISLISGRFLIQPMVLARLLQLADIREGDRVLDLGVATGYSTLVIAALTSSIYSVEPDALLHKEAEKNIETYAKGKAKVLAGAPVEGCIEGAPFDVIFINGSVDYVPDYLFEQLAEGGRLVAIVRRYGAGRASHAGQARLYRKINEEISWTSPFDLSASPAPGFNLPEKFSL